MYNHDNPQGDDAGHPSGMFRERKLLTVEKGVFLFRGKRGSRIWWCRACEWVVGRKLTQE